MISHSMINGALMTTNEVFGFPDPARQSISVFEKSRQVHIFTFFLQVNFLCFIISPYRLEITGAFQQN
jgi:hypothetical protein